MPKNSPTQIVRDLERRATIDAFTGRYTLAFARKMLRGWQRSRELGHGRTHNLIYWPAYIKALESLKDDTK